MKTWWNLDNPYEYRNENLKRLGFKTFRLYLKSELWRTIRARVLARPPEGLCQKCQRKKATQVHHRAYDMATLAGTNVDSLTKTCARCHVKAERPDDHGQSAYDRLQRANEFLSRPNKRHARERELKSAKKRWTKGAA